MSMVSLFSGIGGFEVAFKRAGFDTSLICEIDNVASAVLSSHFKKIPIIKDVRDIKDIPSDAEVLCAGFPCQDVSSIGEKLGMAGERTSLIKEVFRILRRNRVEWVVLENVPYMLKLNQGETIRTVVEGLEALGYRWAYRIVNSISFLPQKRCRVFVVASLHGDPRNVILSQDVGEIGNGINFNGIENPVGFYWTEGRYALGLMSNAIPTLKAGSTIGIPSPPALLLPNNEIVTPDIRDAERLQGFRPDWTKPAQKVARESFRWRLVGNAVTVNTVAWIARKILRPVPYNSINDTEPVNIRSWPNAAWGMDGRRFISNVSTCPRRLARGDIRDFLRFPTKRLSLKAAQGFYNRLVAGRARAPHDFQNRIENFIQRLENENE